MKLCVIGCGGISQSVHGPSYKEYKTKNSDFVLAACCDIKREVAESYAKRFGFQRAYTNFEQMIESEKPDAVCVTVTESATASVGKRILEYGIPMLIEKPPGKTVSETEMLRDAALKGAVPHIVAFNRRFMPVMAEGRRRIESSGMPVREVRYSMYRLNRNDIDFSDTAVHAIDAVRFLSGADYETVRFRRQPIAGRYADNVFIDAAMTNGARASISILPNCGVNIERAEVHCDGASYFFALPTNISGIDGAGSLAGYVKGAADVYVRSADLSGSEEGFIVNGFYNENAVFFDSVRDGTLSATAFEDALNAMAVKEAYANGMESWRK